MRDSTENCSLHCDAQCTRARTHVRRIDYSCILWLCGSLGAISHLRSHRLPSARASSILRTTLARSPRATSALRATPAGGPVVALHVRPLALRELAALPRTARLLPPSARHRKGAALEHPLDPRAVSPVASIEGASRLPVSVVGGHFPPAWEVARRAELHHVCAASARRARISQGRKRRGEGLCAHAYIWSLGARKPAPQSARRRL